MSCALSYNISCIRTVASDEGRILPTATIGAIRRHSSSQERWFSPGRPVLTYPNGAEGVESDAGYL